ncbi:unnamed protein product [Discosporangium mesarthrocarpum]
MDVITIVTLVYGVGSAVITKCGEAKQCEVEAGRIAIRTQNILATLQSAVNTFKEDIGLCRNLLKLKEILEIAQDWVGRCSRRGSMKGRITANIRSGTTRAKLVDLETDLERLTKDLGLPMLAGIRIQLNNMEDQVRQQIATGNEDVVAAVRKEIANAMEVHSRTGPSIKEVIRTEMAKLYLDNSKCGEEERPSITEGTRMTSHSHRLGRVRFDQLEEQELLGQGSFGVVHAGRYCGKDVAIKKTREMVTSQEIINAFRQEVEIHFSLRHQNVVELIAFSLGENGRPPCMVMELMSESLYDFIGLKPNLNLNVALDVISDICKGLNFLHQHGIIHRDIKSLNVLLDGDLRAKLSDFGLADVTCDIASKTGSALHPKVGTTFWMAPEIHQNLPASFASDIFSLHVVMWEVLSEQKVGTGTPIGIAMLQNQGVASLSLRRSKVTGETGRRLQNLLNMCGAVKEVERPESGYIVDELRSICSHCSYMQVPHVPPGVHNNHAWENASPTVPINIIPEDTCVLPKAPTLQSPVLSSYVSEARPILEVGQVGVFELPPAIPLPGGEATGANLELPPAIPLPGGEATGANLEPKRTMSSSETRTAADKNLKDSRKKSVLFRLGSGIKDMMGPLHPGYTDP